VNSRIAADGIIKILVRKVTPVTFLESPFFTALIGVVKECMVCQGAIILQTLAVFTKEIAEKIYITWFG